MRGMLALGVRELAARRGVTLAVVLGVAVAVLIVITVESLAGGIGQAIASGDEARLLVLQRGAGMVWWSYLSTSVIDDLAAAGIDAVPEIFALREGAPGDYLLFRGVPLDRYREVEPFTVVAGRALGPGDDGRVMIGATLASRRKLAPGQILSVAGQVLPIVGVFRTGLVADNEVWLDIGQAARLFNFRGTYSAAIVRGDAALAGAIEAFDVQVVRESEIWDSWRGTQRGFHLLLRLAAGILAAAAALGITNLAFTVVKQREWEIAILRAVGFSRRQVMAYVVAQTAAVALIGSLVAIAATWVLLRGVAVYAWGFTLRPQIRPDLLGLILLGATAIGILAGASPAVAAGRVSVSDALRRE